MMESNTEKNKTRPTGMPFEKKNPPRMRAVKPPIM